MSLSQKQGAWRQEKDTLEAEWLQLMEQLEA
jgi:hypothetical protein